MISINNLTIKFDQKVIFDYANFTIYRNEFVCIKGPSGSGKSTLLSVIGLLSKDIYDYTFENVKIDKKNKEQIRKDNFAYIFQEDLLINYLNVYDNLVMPLKNLHQKFDKSEVEKIAKELNIFDLLYKDAKKLSGGEKQRVSIARAILCQKSVITADEPTGSLDPINSKIVMDLLKKAQKDFHKTIILVTHSDLYDSYFDRIVNIEGHQICDIK